MGAICEDCKQDMTKAMGSDRNHCHHFGCDTPSVVQSAGAS